MSSLSKKIIILVVFCFVTVNFYGQVYKSPQAKLLEKAYKQHSLKKLDKFFSNWHKEIPPASDSEVNSLKPEIQEAYKVFNEIYTVPNLENLFGLSKGNGAYKDLKYIVVQNKISIYISEKFILDRTDSDNVFSMLINKGYIDSNERSRYFKVKRGKMELAGEGEDLFRVRFDPPEYLKDEVKNFRPACFHKEKIPVFENSEYVNIFSYYLCCNRLSPFSFLISHRVSHKDPLEKETFISPYIRFFRGMSDGPYPYFTKISKIAFDKSFSNARIIFGIGYFTGETTLKKVNEKWIIVSSRQIIARGVNKE